MLNTSIQIGALTLPNRVLLAPLAGVTDVPFRRMCRELGAGLCFVEMLASNAVLQRNPRTQAALARHADEDQLGVQVTGPSAEQVAGAVGVLEQEGFDLIDLNLGCPVKKVISKGWGSALLGSDQVRGALLEACRAATALPLSAKIRLGLDRDRVVVKQVAAEVARAGYDMLTIHGRTREETYEVPVDYEGIALGCETARSHAVRPMLLTGNGDILGLAAARRMLDQTGCDLVMVSRGALGNPWIFRELLEERPRSVTAAEWLDGVQQHLDYHEAFYGRSRHTAVMARKHLAWYATGFPGIRALRVKVSMTEDLQEAREQCKAFAATLTPGTLRYGPPERGERVVDDPRNAMDRTTDRSAAEEGYEG